MSPKLSLLLLFIIHCEVQCIITRSEVLDQYKSTLQILKQVTDAKYVEKTSEYNALNSQLVENNAKAINATNSHITQLRSHVVASKKIVNISTKSLNCLKEVEKEANLVTNTNLRSCYTTANSSLLLTAKGKFTTISTLTNNVPSYCQSLNPLDTQIQSYLRCFSEKIPDLNQQISIVENEYDNLGNVTLRNNIQCLTEKSGAIFSQLSILNYRVTSCFFNSV